jgi:hypothetical protein
VTVAAGGAADVVLEAELVLGAAGAGVAAGVYLMWSTGAGCNIRSSTPMLRRTSEDLGRFPPARPRLMMLRPGARVPNLWTTER